MLILLLPLTTICVALAGFYVWHRQLIRKRLFEVAEAGLASGPVSTPRNGEMLALPAEFRPFTSPHTMIRPRLFWTASIPRNCTEPGSFIHFSTPVATASCWLPLRPTGRPGSIAVPSGADGHVLYGGGRKMASGRCLTCKR